MTRENFSRALKRAAQKRSGGRCEVHLLPPDLTEITGATCDRVAEEFDHVFADCLGGDASLENCAHLCKVHHKVKTATDQKYRAKRNKHRIDREKRDKKRAQPKPKMQSRGFSKTLKRKFNGEVCPR